MNLPVVYHPDYVTPLPEQHRFPMPKFRLLYELLWQDGVINHNSVYQPTIANNNLLQLVHGESYVRRFCDGSLDEKAKRRIGLPWSNGLVKRTCTAVGGTVLTVQLALKHGICCNLAGGTHHAFPDYGSGFCIFNDLAIASSYLLKEKIVNKILIVDLDVHQGDGTAFIFRHEERVFTFSMHCEANFPYRKQESDLDIPLPIGLDDDGYLQILAFHLKDLLTQVKPDIVIYDAGVDVSSSDRLGKLSLTDTGIYRREMMVLSTCLGEGYPVASVIGGGYCTNLEELVYRHSLIHRAASECLFNN